MIPAPGLFTARHGCVFFREVEQTRDQLKAHRAYIEREANKPRSSQALFNRAKLAELDRVEREAEVQRAERAQAFNQGRDAA